MKQTLFILTLLLTTSTISAQYRTNVSLDGLNDRTFCSSLETALSNLLSEFNRAYITHSDLNLSKVKLDTTAKNTIEMLWESSPFLCDTTNFRNHCLQIYGSKEYEVRNIPIFFLSGNEHQKVAVTFDQSGKITSFRITLPGIEIDTTGEDITDIHRRQIILDYVEQFRTAYNTKDIDFLTKVFSDDALIIVGRNVVVKKDNIILSSRTEYYKETKAQYLAKLRQVFKIRKWISVKFEDIQIRMHPTKKDWYGVSLRQKYDSDGYSDDGYLFLLWDFTEGNDHPKIHVRTWEKEKNFGLEDVNIY